MPERRRVGPRDRRTCVDAHFDAPADGARRHGAATIGVRCRASGVAGRRRQQQARSPTIAAHASCIIKTSTRAAPETNVRLPDAPAVARVALHDGTQRQVALQVDAAAGLDAA